MKLTCRICDNITYVDDITDRYRSTLTTARQDTTNICIYCQRGWNAAISSFCERVRERVGRHISKQRDYYAQNPPHPGEVLAGIMELEGALQIISEEAEKAMNPREDCER